MMKIKQITLGLFAVVLTLVLSVAVYAADTKGKVKTVDATNSKLVFTDTNDKDWTFQLAKDAKIFVNDKEMKLADLKPNDEASVVYEKKDDQLMASEIRATRK